MSKKKERVAYGYKSNRSFIEDSYKLLEKLSEKGLWNKDTLVIGLDKSVRPLAYTMRKLSKEEGREVPEIRYFNYSRLNPEKSKDQIDNISEEILGNIKGKGLENYKKIVILDEYVLSGNSVEGSKAIFEKVFPRAELYSAVLSKDPSIKTENENLIYANTKLLSRAKSYETGIEDASEGKSFLVSKSISKNEKENYKMFVQNRKQLSRDINSYLHGKHPATIKKKSRTIERIVSGIFVFSFFAGLFMSTKTITGNIIGNAEQPANLFGIFLLLFGAMGFFIQLKLRKNKKK